MPKATTKSDKKTARDLENWALHAEKERFGGLNRSERRQIVRYFKIDLDEVFSGFDSNEQRKTKARRLRQRLIERKKHLIPTELINSIK